MVSLSWDGLGLILGGAVCLWDDVMDLEFLCGERWGGVVCAVNDVGVHWPRPLHYWISLHPFKLLAWEEQRAAAKHPGQYVTCAQSATATLHPGRQWDRGSSGMYAVQAMLGTVGLRKVVLAGMPMERMRYIEESHARHHVTAEGEWSDADVHWPAWKRQARRMCGRVRSMGGRTATLLGRPTLEWLKEGNDA